MNDELRRVIDITAAGVARRFTLDTEEPRRASLQLAVAAAMELALMASGQAARAASPVLPSATEYSAAKAMAVTKEWCRGWDDYRAMLAASPPAPPTPQQPVAYRFGDLLCRLLECEELGPFTDRMPANLLREWQEATDEHIDRAAAQPPTPQPPQGAQQE